LSETIALEMTRKWIEITTAGGEEEAAEAAKPAAEEKANNVNAQLNGGLVADSVGLVALFLVLSLLAALAILAALVDLASVIE
jgi:hypothetical protein